MLPHQLREELKRLSLIFISLAPLEWHGLHLAIGTDPINAEHVALEVAKRIGGVVLQRQRDFLAALIYLTDPNMFTLSLGLLQYQSQHGGTEWHMLMAASSLITFPIIILFFFTQKTFIQGISLTGLKG